MNTKSQRIRITEAGWGNYTGAFGGVEFDQGLSVESVDPMHISRLGSILAISMVDTNTQGGVGADLQRMQDTGAEVVPESPRTSESAAEVAPVANKTAYTREQLEKVADKHGIAGLRTIAEPMSIKGRGIHELIEEILKFQAA